MYTYTKTEPEIASASDFYNSFYYNLLTAMKYLQKWLEIAESEKELGIFQQACNTIVNNFYFTNSKELSTRLLIQAIEVLPDNQKFIFVHVIQDFVIWYFNFMVGALNDYEELFFEKNSNIIFNSYDAFFSKDLLSYFLSIIYKPMYGITVGITEMELAVSTDFGFLTDKYKLGLDNRNMPIGSIWFDTKVQPSIFNM